MSSIKKDPLRTLTNSERRALEQLARSQSAPAASVARARALLAVSRRTVPAARGADDRRCARGCVAGYPWPRRSRGQATRSTLRFWARAGLGEGQKKHWRSPALPTSGTDRAAALGAGRSQRSECARGGITGDASGPRLVRGYATRTASGARGSLRRELVAAKAASAERCASLAAAEGQPRSGPCGGPQSTASRSARTRRTDSFGTTASN